LVTTALPCEMKDLGTGLILSVQSNQFVQIFPKVKICSPRCIRARSFVGRSVSANVDGDEQLIGATCDSVVGSGLEDEVLMFTSVDSSG